MRAAWCVVLVTACGGPPSTPGLDAAPDAPPDAPPSTGLVDPPDPASAPCAGRLGFPGPPSLRVQAVQQVEVADLDGNGVRDLVFTNGTTIAMARGNGDGTFAPPTTVAASGGAFRLVDLDLDGTPEVVHGVTPQSGEVRVTRNVGGNFEIFAFLSMQTAVVDLEVTDVDGDGVLDIIAMAQGSASVSRGLGPFTFDSSDFINIASFSQQTDHAVADVTGDGRPDLVATNNTGVHVLPNLGDGTFGTRITSPLVNATRFVLADVDHDGKRDVVAATFVGTLAVLLNQGDGSFGAEVNQPLPGAAAVINAIVTDDIDHDGNADLAVARGDRGVSVLLGDPAGGLTPAIEIPSAAATHIAFDDLDGDGFDDAVVGAQSAITIHRNTRTTPLFEARSQHAFGNEGIGGQGVVALDLDDSGVPDLVEVTANARVLMRLADGTGGYGAPSTLISDVNVTRLAVADFDNDQRRDLLVEGDGLFELQILHARGDGTLTPAPARMIGAHDEFRVADFNGDGIRDLVIANAGVFPAYRSDVMLYPGAGDGTFGSPEVLWTGIGLEGIAVGDANGDRILDLAIAEYPFEERVAIVLGTGRGAVAAPVSAAVPGRPRRHLAFRDLDGDGHADLVGFWATTLAVVRGRGDGTFGTLVTSPMQAVEPRHAALADFDGDGRLDIVFTNTHLVGLARGRGDASFEPPLWFEGGALSVMPVDLDGDGRLDIVTEDGRGASILRGHCL